jgi:5-methylcytosine-specific restriction endonuclease McrBC regulatory subunit McrC
LKRLQLQVAEYGLLALPEGEMRSKVRDRLLASTAALPFNAFVYDRRGLRADAAVGAIDVGLAQIEILPKVSTTSTVEEDRLFLLDLLRFSRALPSLFIDSARVSSRRHTLLEAIIQATTVEVLRLLERGIPRRYEEISAVAAQVRGRIDFGRYARQLPTDRHRVPVRYAPLQRNNPLTEVIRSLVDVLKAATRVTTTDSSLRHAERLLGSMPPRALTPELVQKVSLTRYEQEWEPIVTVARLLATSRTPDPVTTAETRSFSLLFELDWLFEGVLRRVLEDALPNYALRLGRRAKLLNLLSHEVDPARQYVRLKPDLLVEDESGNAVLVADGKWKVLKKPPAHGLKSADAFQIATYMARHGVKRGVLIYPMVGWMRADPPVAVWRTTFDLIGSPATVTIMAVDIHALVSSNSVTRKNAATAMYSVIAHLAS